MAHSLASGADNAYSRLALAIQFFNIPQNLHSAIAQAWQNAGKRTLPEYAPYAAYCLTVELFFQIALGAGLIGGERPSNRTDIAYLFYLPFSMVFVSSDDLHRRTAPLFMRPEQAFAWGIDLKVALKSINEHFLQLSEDERDKGISAFAHSPPAGNLVADLWDRFMRRGYRDEEPVKMDPEKQAELLKWTVSASLFSLWQRHPRVKPRRPDGQLCELPTALGLDPWPPPAAQERPTRGSGITSSHYSNA